MATPPISEERQKRIRAAIEESLRDGFDPFRQKRGGRGSCIPEAVRRLNERGYDETKNTVSRFVFMQEERAAAGKENMLPDWSLFTPQGLAPAEIKRGQIHRWIFTAAQDDTDIHLAFWNNLQAYASHLGAQILIGGFTYNQQRHTDRMTLTGTFRPELAEFLRFDEVECGPAVFYANMNTLPSAVRPLSGLHSHSRGRDAIYPHAKHAYESIPATLHDYVPVMATTGCVTVENYIPKKAGEKAKFHHVLGAVILEVDSEQNVWLRPISAAKDGTFQDLDAVVRDTKVTLGHRVETVTWGDIHYETIEPDIFHHCWGRQQGSLIDSLRPRYQFMHDLLNFAMWSRHVVGDPHHRAEMEAMGEAGLREHVRGGVQFLRTVERDFCKTIVVPSNHNDRIVQFAKAKPDLTDVENLEYWCELNLAALRAARHRDEEFDLIEWAIRIEDKQRLEGFDIPPRGASFKVLGVEHLLHGDKGINGAKGTPAGLAKMGAKVTIGDKHSPAIFDGVYVAGMTGALDQGYNNGPGSWKRAHVIGYPNGKRTIVTQAEDGRWRA